MKDNKNIVDDLKRRKKPEVPKGFFENFSDDLMAKIFEQESGLDGIQKTAKPDVPAEFFKNFAQDITQKDSAQPEVEQDKPVQVFSIKVVGFVTAVAACLTIMFLVMPDEKPQQAENDVIAPQTEEEAISDEELLAYVDADDIIEYILEEDIEIDAVEESETSEVPEALETSPPNFDDLEDEDILYFFEDDIDDLYLDDFEL